MKKITNLTSRALPLSDDKGTILAAANTDGCSKVVENISEEDARRLSGLIHISDVEVEATGKTQPAEANVKERK